MKKIPLMLIVVLWTCVSLFGQAEWKKEYHDSVVTVYSRKVPGRRYKEFKSITEVESHIQAVYDVFADFDSYERWYGFCKESYRVKTLSTEREIAFILIDSPWPFIDKYMLADIYLDSSYGDGEAHIYFELATEEYDIPPGKYEPVDVLRGECILEQIETAATKVTFINIMDPGGDIPPIFLERFRMDQIIETAANLRRYLKRP